MSFTGLPKEVHSAILTFLYRSLPTHFHRRKTHPLRHLQTLSSYWNGIIKITPSLWTIIPVSLPVRRTWWEQRVRLYIERSNGLPLCLLLERGCDTNQALHILEPLRSRWQELVFISSIIERDAPDPRPFLTGPLPALRALEFNGQPETDVANVVVDAPSLSTVICKHQPLSFSNGISPPITSLTLRWDRQPQVPVFSLHSVLVLGPTLKELQLSGDQVHGWEVPLLLSMNFPQLPNLQQLTFDEWGLVPCAFLQYVQLPILSRLVVLKGGRDAPPAPFPIMASVEELVWEESTSNGNLDTLKSVLLSSPNTKTITILNAKELKRVKKLNMAMQAAKSRQPTKSDVSTQPKDFKESSTIFVEKSRPRNDALKVLLMGTVGHGATYCPDLLVLHLYHASVVQLGALTDVRRNLKSVTLRACRKEDFSVEHESLCVDQVKAPILEKVKRRVDLILPQVSLSTTPMDDGDDD